MEMGTDFSLLAAWCDARASFVPAPCQPAALPARDYKLLVVNLDNTLLRSNKTLSPAAVRLIAAASAKGKQVVVCSGRAASEALPHWGTQPDGSPGLAAAGVRHAILSFGCETWTMGATPEQSRATCRTLLAPRMVRCVMDVLRNRDLLVQAVMDDGYFHASERMLPRAGEFYQNNDINPSVFRDTIAHPSLYAYLEAHLTQVERFFVFHRNFTERMDTMVRLRDQPVSLALLHATQLHIDPMGTNKATGLVGMCHELGVSFDDVMAIGDSPGDETYLRMAGCSIAMGNAVRHVQDWCDLVVASNDDDGVAEAVQKYFL